MSVKMLSPSPYGHEAEDEETSMIQPNYYLVITNRVCCMKHTQLSQVDDVLSD